MIDGGFISSINFARVVTSQAQAAQRFVRKRLNKLKQARVAAKEMLARVGAGGNDELLILAVDQLAHTLDEQAFGIAFQNRIPFAAPKHLDHVPAGAAERGFQLLNDLPVATHGTIQALQVAIHDEDQIIELFPGCQRDRAKGFRLVRFAVADERPNLCIGSRLQTAIFEIAIEARLIDGHQRA